MVTASGEPVSIGSCKFISRLPALQATSKLGLLNNTVLEGESLSPTLDRTLNQGISACAQTLDELALSLPAKHVLPGALEFVARAMLAPKLLNQGFSPCAQTLDELALSLPAKHLLPGTLDIMARAVSVPIP